MKKIRKAVLSLMLAATMTASVMPAMANAESEAEIKDSAVKNVELLPFVNELMKHEPDNDKTYSQFSLEEIVQGLVGNYTPTGNVPSTIDGNWYPTMRQPFYSVVLDENGTQHGIRTYFSEIEVKVKENTELPLEDMKASVEEKGCTMPTFKKEGNIYLIYEAEDLKSSQAVIEELNNCSDVLSIDKHYATFYDNSFKGKFTELIYYGEMSSENRINMIPELELYENTNEAERQHRLEIPAFGNYTSSFYLGENAVRTGSSIYDIVSRLYNSDFKFSLVSQGYAAGLFTADIYYNGRSSAPILVDGLDGDANVDGSTNLSDAVTVMQSIANPDKYNVSAQGSKNADTDGNGITNADALNIQKQLLGL